MKKYYLMLLVTVLAVLMSSCRSGYINLTNDEQEIKMASAGGNVEPERFINIKNKEAHGYALQTMYNELASATASGDTAKMRIMINMIQEFNMLNYGFFGNSVSGFYGQGKQGPMILVKLSNLSDRTVKIKSSPFANLTIMAGETYGPFALTKGTHLIDYEVIYNENGRAKTKRFKYNFDVNKNNSLLTFDP